MISIGNVQCSHMATVEIQGTPIWNSCCSHLETMNVPLGVHCVPFPKGTFKSFEMLPRTT